MATARRHCTRRRFFGAAAASTVAAALGRLGRVYAEGLDKPRNRKMILSFYCDDTGPHVAGAKAFETFLDYCAHQGIAGESSAILGASGYDEPNPAIWKALLNLAKEGRFRGRTIPCFFNSSESHYGIHRKASDGEYAIYDLMPNAEDRFGIWENNPKRVNPDYYITEDGTSGILVRHIQSGAPYCIWYAHWQGLNPAKGVGWPAFVAVVERIKRHLSDHVVWMRPSEITDRYHAAEGWSFLENV